MQRQPEATLLSDYKPSEFLIDKVDLTFDLGEETTIVRSRMDIMRNPLSQDKSTTLALDGDELELMQIELDGRILTEKEYEVTDKGLKIFNVPDKFKLNILNKIHPSKNTKLQGLFVSKGNFCTHCEAEGFRRITYFLDRPDVMAKYTTKIIADADKFPTLLSNGNIVRSGTLKDNRKFIVWDDPIRKSSYLFAMVAGDYEVIMDSYTTKSGKVVSLEVYCERGYGDRLQHAMNALKKAIAWDEEKYGYECKWSNFKIAAVTDFNMGAMENPGLNIFNAARLYANVKTSTDDDFEDIEGTIVHEVLHSFTGDEVGELTWFDLTGKEGLTTAREMQNAEDYHGVTARIKQVNVLRNFQFPEDASPLAHPVQPQSYIATQNLYTWTVYKKGAEIFRMMRELLGDETYRKGMQIYYDAHHGKAASVRDYVAAMAKASKKDLRQFAGWFSQVGTPVVDVSGEYDSVRQRYTLTIKQSCKPPMMLPIKVALFDCNGVELTVEKTLTLTEESQKFTFNYIPSKPVPSLLRNFSAPVKLNYQYSDEDLKLLAKKDTDQFNRWEMSQRYIKKTLFKLIADYQANGSIKVPDELINYFDDLLKDANVGKDLALISLMLKLPEEYEIANEMGVIDVNAICAVRKKVMQAVAGGCWSRIVSGYQAHINVPYQAHYNKEDADKRRYKSLCLSYLMANSTPGVNVEAKRQFDTAQFANMTDTFNAMCLLANNQCEEGSEALDVFYQQWKNDPIVITKWFSAIANANSPDTLQRVKAIMDDKVFDIKTPQHVRSLLRSFTRNLSSFHAPSGEGYVFLTDLIIKLDPNNPGVAAGLAENYSRWNSYANPQRDLMRQQLERLSQQPNLSKNLFEIVSKSLGEEVKKEAKVTEVVATLFTPEPSAPAAQVVDQQIAVATPH